MQATHILGIDISKDKFDVCLLNLATRATVQPAPFPNNPAGCKQLQRWLKAQAAGPLHACLEATSRYGDALALFLHAQAHTVSVVNPRRIRHFAHSQLLRTQNDAVDARLIADFCATQAPRAWQPAPAALGALQALTRARQFFCHEVQRLQNRLATEPAATAKWLRQHIKSLHQTLRKLEAHIQAHLAAETALADQVALVDSINGIGLVTAATVVAELPPIERFAHAGQLVALAGLDPRKKDSGSSVRGRARLSKMGSAGLRGCLYMAAVVGLTHNPLLRAQAERLRAKGHKGKLIVCAAMRKLIRLIYGVLKHRQPFDPNWPASPTSPLGPPLPPQLNA